MTFIAIYKKNDETYDLYSVVKPFYESIDDPNKVFIRAYDQIRAEYGDRNYALQLIQTDGVPLIIYPVVPVEQVNGDHGPYTLDGFREKFLA